VKKSKGLIDGVGRSAHGAILPFTRLLGVVGLVTGAFTALVKVGSTIASIFDSAADRANRFQDGRSSLAAVANRAAVAQDIETTAARIEKLRAIVNDNSFLGSLERVGRFLIGQGTPGQMNQEVERLQRLERELRARLHAFELEERRRKRQQDYEEARKKSVQAVIDLQREAHRMAEELDEEGLTQAERIEKKYQKIMEMVRALRGLGQDAAADRLEESARRSRERELRAL